MTPVPSGDVQDGGVQPAIDPISRVGMSTVQVKSKVIHTSTQQIIQRTQTSHKVSPQNPHNVASPHSSGTFDETIDGLSIDSEALRRSDSVSNRLPKEKKKGVSFLSRIIGGKKREDSFDIRDNASEITEDRSGGNDAEVFTQPVGFIPKFPAPPRYIRVKAQNRKKRDFDRLFLAQILLDPSATKSRRSSSQVDARIHGINETPTVPPPNSSSKTNENAVWAAEFSKDGKYFAAAGQDKKLRVWEVISKEEKEGREEERQSENGSENDQGVKLNAPVFKQKLVREYDGHTAAILDLSWSKNNFLLSSSMDKTVRLYHVSRSECLCAFKHNDFVTSIQFHPRDDRFFLAGSLDSKLRLWSIPDKSVAYWAQVPDMVTAVAFTPDGKTAIAGTLSGICILYTTEGLRAHSQIHVRSTRGRNTKGSKITGIDTIAIPRAHSPPDIKLLITSNDSRIRMYNLKDRALELKFRGNENTTSQIRAYFSDDGKFVICGSEDRKVYIWPTGPIEKPDTDKRPLEVFEAHSQIITTAVLAPTNTRKLLAQASDPIYDICNPPPVVLLSRADSIMSSPSNTNRSGQSDEKHNNSNGVHTSDPRPKPAESPSFTARHSHEGGHIIVTADSSGQVKVFRQDCAYQKRRDSLWDTGSTFSKRMLGRSGSITPRTSIASSNHRSSLNSTSRNNPSAERINSWRNSIVNSNGAAIGTADTNIRRSNSERSKSPRRSLANRFSLRPNPSHLSNISMAAPSTSPGTSTVSHAATPEITVQSPLDPTPITPTHQPAAEAQTNPTPHSNYTGVMSYQTSSIGPLGLTGEPQADHKTQVDLLPVMNRNAEDNPLFLIGDQSYQAWDMQNTVLPMIDAVPRTPSLTPENPLSRHHSIVSQLSSEMPSPNLSSEPAESATASGHLRIDRRGSGESKKTGEDEELKCRNCGGERFKVYKVDAGGRGLKCRDCGVTV